MPVGTRAGGAADGFELVSPVAASGSAATVTTIGGSSQTNTLSAASGWTPFTFTFTAPSNCAGGVSMVLGGGAPDEPVYFDDVSLTSASVSGGANQISNPAFTNLTVAWTNYGGSGTGPLLTQTRVHSGTTSLLTAPTAYLGQTISGLIPNSSYTVSAFISGGTGTLTAGSAHTTATGTSGWTEINVTAASNSSGNLAITATNTGSSGNVYWDDFSINGSTYAGGQEFSYDGFGNLLTQQPVFGTAPMMTLAVNPNTNQVTSGGATYDAAGNLTYDGTTNYTFDEMNRMTQASGPYGTFGYSYSPGENKRMVVYGSSSNPQTLTMFLYAPNGKVLSQLAYQKNGSNWAPIAINALTNYLYLGSKALSYAENNVSSNASGTYWPYGSTNTNPTTGPSTFATYLGDWSTLYYSDQRYYDYNWGRFLTADRGNKNVDLTNSGSWNKYAYVNGDPINGMDPTGQDFWDDGFACGDIEGSYGGYGGGIGVQVGQAADDWMNQFGNSPVTSCVGDCEIEEPSATETNNQLTTVYADLTNGVVAQAGGNIGPLNGSVSYVPSTGAVYGTVAGGVPVDGAGGYVAVGLTSSPDQSGPSVSGSAFVGLGGTASVNPQTGDYTWGVGLGTVGMGASGGITSQFGSVPSMMVPISITAIPSQYAVPIGDGLYVDEFWP